MEHSGYLKLGVGKLIYLPTYRKAVARKKTVSNTYEPRTNNYLQKLSGFNLKFRIARGGSVRAAYPPILSVKPGKRKRALSLVTVGTISISR